MKDDFQLDERIAELLEQADRNTTPPFAYFQELVFKQRRRSWLETMAFALVAILLLTIMVSAVMGGQKTAVGLILGLVWFCLPLILLALPGREKVENAEY